MPPTFRTHSTMTHRTYDDAQRALDGMINAPPPSSDTPPSLSNDVYMRTGMEKLGITDEKVKQLKIIHIAGTKGKGSTSVMCESILLKCGLKTGMFTSPHITDVRERIRISGKSIEKDLFAKYFFEVWDAQELGPKESEGNCPQRAHFFRLVALTALHTFVQEGVDVAVLEVGIGGDQDATNAVPSKRVAGITHIGYDHTEILGDTLTKIAFAKAGIARSNVPCLLAPLQEAEAQAELERTATAAGAKVATCPVWEDYPGSAGVVLGLAGEHQKQNASLAAALCQTWLEQERGETLSCLEGTPATLPAAFKEGLEEAQWAGRCQTIELAGGNLRLMLDGAHTDDSVRCALKWFASVEGEGRSRELLFYCIWTRDPAVFLRLCAESEYGITHAHFSPILSSKGTIFTSNTVDEETTARVTAMKESWQTLVCIP